MRAGKLLVGKVQHLLSAEVHAHSKKAALARLPAEADRQLSESACNEANAALLGMAPTPLMRLTDPQYRSLVRRRLGLACAGGIRQALTAEAPRGGAPVACCPICSAPLTVGHERLCRATRGMAYGRHNAIRDLLHSMLHSVAGIGVRAEQSLSLRELLDSRATARRSGDAERAPRQRPDLTFWIVGKSRAQYVDVTVTEAARAGFSLVQAEADKQKKYQGFLAEYPGQFWPVALSSVGELGPEAGRFVEFVADVAREQEACFSRRMWLARLARALAICAHSTEVEWTEKATEYHRSTSLLSLQLEQDAVACDLEAAWT